MSDQLHRQAEAYVTVTRHPATTAVSRQGSSMWMSDAKSNDELAPILETSVGTFHGWRFGLIQGYHLGFGV